MKKSTVGSLFIGLLIVTCINTADASPPPEPIIVSAVISPSGLVPTRTKIRLEGTVTVATSVSYTRHWQITSNGGATWTDWKFPTSSHGEDWINEGYGAVISYNQSKAFACEWTAGDYTASMWDSESKVLDTKTYQFRLVARTSDGDHPSNATAGVGQLAPWPINTQKFYLDSSPSSYSGGVPLRLDASDGHHWFFASSGTENNAPLLYFRVETYNNTIWWFVCRLTSTSSSFVIGRNYSECKAYGTDDGSLELGFTAVTRKKGTTLSGSFTVRELVVAKDGVLMSAAVDFVQYDEEDTNKWNRGQIRFNSDYPIVLNPALDTVRLSSIVVPLSMKNFKFVGANADLPEPHFEFEVHNAQIGRLYRIESSVNLMGWHVYGPTNYYEATTVSFIAGGTLVPQSSERFFRVVEKD